MKREKGMRKKIKGCQEMHSKKYGKGKRKKKEK